MGKTYVLDRVSADLARGFTHTAIQRLSSQVAANPTGAVELPARGKLPRISAIACELLARDADFQAVLFHGARPLAVSNKLHAGNIPTDTRLGVRARDQGCRFPGSRDPITFTDIHHTVERADGGLHHPDLLVSFDRRSHRTVHKRGWNVTLDPDAGVQQAIRQLFTTFARTGSARAVVALVRSSGATPIGVGALIDRGDATRRIDYGVPLASLLRLETSSWDPDECPLCADKVALDDPGSRRI
jgi:hypothetical protein